MYKSLITYLNMIGVKLGARQTVESAEIQTTRKDAVGTAALSANR